MRGVCVLVRLSVFVTMLIRQQDLNNSSRDIYIWFSQPNIFPLTYIWTWTAMYSARALAINKDHT